MFYASKIIVVQVFALTLLHIGMIHIDY